MLLYFFALVLLPPAIVPNSARWFGYKWRIDIIFDRAELYLIRGHCSYSPTMAHMPDFPVPASEGAALSPIAAATRYT